ncbi:MAG: tetratricopeptide repeat protein [Bacteroidia bacterium]|nr:tetratricopeptide repeat protein [Bacteroidia bacterium]
MIEQEAVWNLAKVYFELERYPEAIDNLKLFISSYPQNPKREEAIELLGRAYLYSNQYEEAMAYIESLPQRSPSINRAYQQIAFSQGVENFNRADYNQAVAMFQKSLRYPQIPELVKMAQFLDCRILFA